jgi:hypothetical protein
MTNTKMAWQRTNSYRTAELSERQVLRGQCLLQSPPTGSSQLSQTVISVGMKAMPPCISSCRAEVPAAVILHKHERKNDTICSYGRWRHKLSGGHACLEDPQNRGARRPTLHRSQEIHI